MVAAQISEIFKKQEVSSNSPLPKYQQVGDSILSVIESGGLKPGDKIPTETDLTFALPVSLGTVQKALGMLTERGILVRQRGSGTFVAEREVSLDDLWHFRFIGPDGENILPVTTRVLSIDREVRAGLWSRFLGRDDFFVRVTREVKVDKDFCVISQFFLRGKQFSELLAFKISDLEGVHLREVIRDRFAKTTDQVREQVVAETFPDTVCHRLKLPPRRLGLVCHILRYTLQQEPLSFQQLYVPSNVALLEIRETKPG